MDSFIYGATSYGDFNCDMSPKYVDFVNHETKFSQITFTEAAVECMLNSMAHSEILDLKLNQQQMVAFGKAFNLKSGMLFEADIMLEQRSLIEWLLEPIYSLRGRVS